MTETTIGIITDIGPSVMKEFKIKELDILVININGEFHAIKNSCSHRGCKLSNGILRGENVLCPCHGSVFNVISGAVVKGPAKEALISYPVLVVDSKITIQI